LELSINRKEKTRRIKKIHNWLMFSFTYIFCGCLKHWQCTLYKNYIFFLYISLITRYKINNLFLIIRYGSHFFFLKLFIGFTNIFFLMMMMMAVVVVVMVVVMMMMIVVMMIVVMVIVVMVIVVMVMMIVMMMIVMIVMIVMMICYLC